MPPATSARPAMIHITIRFAGRFTVTPVFCQGPRRRTPRFPSIFFAVPPSHLCRFRSRVRLLSGMSPQLMVVHRSERRLRERPVEMRARAPRRREVEIARTREDILVAAARALGRSGFGSVSMQDIAAEVGFTAPAL